jgi:hypothetical protein
VFWFHGGNALDCRSSREGHPILKQSVSHCLLSEAGEVGSQGFSEQGWEVFEPPGKAGPGQLHLISYFWASQSGKERLALWGQTETEEWVLQVNH